MKAYHFLREDFTAGKGHEPAWHVGEMRTLKGTIKLRSYGYHTCVTVIADPGWSAVVMSFLVFTSLLAMYAVWEWLRR